MRKVGFGVILVSFTALSEESHPFSYIETRNGDTVLEVRASKCEARGAVMHLSDNLEIKANTLIIHAKEADFNPTTGELETHGPIHIQLRKTQNN